jgi:hypothetical protein
MSSPSVTQASGAPLVTLTTTAETAALTSAAVPFNAPGGQGLFVSGIVTGATGTGTTSVQTRVYRGATISGTLLATLQETNAAGFYQAGFQVLDSAPGANPVYTVSVQQVGATGNGTVTYVNMAVEPATQGAV